MSAVSVAVWISLSVVVGFGLYPRSKAAGGDCMSGRFIDCFECNSWADPRCHDPFNFTTLDRDMPEIKRCSGCCVKLEQYIGTVHYQIKRTCTDNIEANFFIVNHGCMNEGNGHGKICFCEEDKCNGTVGNMLSTFSILIVVGFVILLTT